jgi:histidinol dehydrogenase
VKKTLRIVTVGSLRGRRALARLERRGREVVDARTRRQAERLVEAVRRKGDAALLDAVRRHDGIRPATAAAIRLPVPDADAERSLLPPGYAEALERAIVAVEAFHRRQLRTGFTDERDGVTVEELIQPLGRVGIYVPGGRASYPSTAVMTVVPARVAGVREIVVATPPGSWQANPALRYTLARLGVREVWGMGGAHAVAALAYGTETVPRVDLVAGPGNAWVTAAKRAVAGDVAVDTPAGPTEVVIVAAGDADPELVAADLLAQAEHDPAAAAVLVTDQVGLARRTAAALATQLDQLARVADHPTVATARAALAGFGTALVVERLDEAVAVVARLAPEHLQLVGAEAEALADRMGPAGAVFVGASTPEVFGDYAAGPSHVLPPGGTARWASGLGVGAFLRTSHRVHFTPEAAARWATAAATLAAAEGLPAHAAAARRRLR